MHRSISNLSEIITTNTDFPNNITGRYKTDYSETREVYRQLKFAASKQGDRIKELQYERLEMISYDKTLKWWSSYFPDKSILRTNKWSNNHGQSWTWTLCWFLLTIPLYMFIKIFLDYTFVWGLPRSIDIAQYLNFSVNPLHDFDKVFNGDFEKSYPTGKSRTIDAISRIFSGYLIFQFLRAFRKYVK